MTNLVSSICVFPSQQKDKNLSAQEKLISEIAEQASTMGISFAASRDAIYRMLDQPVSIQPVASDVVKWLNLAKPNSVFTHPLVWTQPSDTINRPSAKR